MKKLQPTIITVLLTLLIISSCTKTDESNPTSDYVCHCTIVSSSGTHDLDIAQNGKTKSEATANCATAQYTYNSGGNTATCTLQ